jgi:7-carboxy-7-deazaguanine synthase
VRRAEPEGTPERCEEWAAADALALHLRGLWGCRDGRPFVVFTGGEPLLRFDAALVVACRERGFGVAVETNGTLPLPCALDWKCGSARRRARRWPSTGPTR